MSHALTQDMVDGQDDMAGLLPAHLPAARTSAFFWQGAPIAIGAGLHAPKKKPTSTPHHITLTGREQGQRDAHRRDALKRGGI